MSTPKAKRAQVAARRTRAIELRARGWTWQEIADELGYSGRGAAHKDVTRALDANRAKLAETVDHYRAVALARLDALLREAWRVLDSPHLLVQGGNVVTVTDPTTGQQVRLRDDDPKLRAIETIRRLEERRAKLLGLDASRHDPDRDDHSAVDAWLDAMFGGRP